MSFSAFIVYTCAGPHGPPRAPERRGATAGTATPAPTCRPRAARREPCADPRRRPAGAAPGARFIVFRLSTLCCFRRLYAAAGGANPGLHRVSPYDALSMRLMCGAPPRPPRDRPGPGTGCDRPRRRGTSTPNRPLLRRSHAHAHASNRRLTCRLHATATDTHAQAPRPAGP